jgi:hypothetical protein
MGRSLLSRASWLCIAAIAFVQISVAGDNYIDRFVFEHARKERIPLAKLASDSEFLRRVYLDVTGKLPTAEQARKFLASNEADKREKLVDSLFPPLPEMGMRSVSEHPFLDRWTYFFNDLFRNGELLGEGINTFHTYIYKSLTLNVPYDEFVRDMITASAVSTWSDGAANFIARSHVFEGDGYQINHEDTADEIAINTTKLFLGVNLECVSCHDGAGHLEKINIWLSRQKRASLFRQASFFGKTFIGPSYGRFPHFRVKDSAAGYNPASKSSLRPPRKATEEVSPTFLLTGEHSRTGESDRQAYARMITTHPQFARATVNLFWSELMGKGIVENPFDFDLARQDPKNPPPAPWTVQPTYPELLDALADDFRKSGYDLRHLIRRIVTSKTYQLSAEAPEGWKEKHDGFLTRRNVRRLSAQQLWDAIADITQVYPEIKVTYSEKKVKYLMQSRSPMDVDKSNRGLFKTLTAFGQCDRYQSEPDLRPSMVQAALLLNDRTLKDRVKVQKGSRTEVLSTAEGAAKTRAIEDLYYAALSRPPSEREMQMTERYLKDHGAQGAEDVVWAVLNGVEFLFN